MRIPLLVASAVMGVVGGAAQAEIVLSMNDNHTVLDDKANQVAPDPVRPDTVDIIDAAN
jgi:NADPH-dependent curcumin reductase CurA